MLHPILHCFKVIADYWSNLHIRWEVHSIYHRTAAPLAIARSNEAR